MGGLEHVIDTYRKLASVAERRGQLAGRDRFLILAAAAACRDGQLPSAEHDRRTIVAHAPHHMLARYASFADAMRDDDFLTFLRRLETRFPLERAEFLLEKSCGEG